MCRQFNFERISFSYNFAKKPEEQILFHLSHFIDLIFVPKKFLDTKNR